MILRDQTHSKARGLGPLTKFDIGLVIQVAFFARAAKAERSVVFEVQGPELVAAGHRNNKSIPVHSHNVPR